MSAEPDPLAVIEDRLLRACYVTLSDSDPVLDAALASLKHEREEAARLREALEGLMRQMTRGSSADLYPGTGAVTRAWEAWRSQTNLLLAGPS